ncbi:MAG: ankyrin repeat domain-containing protein [Wolbachia endosymbiont of Fragariocoptes setiger]|nr:ankyrin repeat domain-containing protein [Wolbachia endosymbiont of Fragariocoptes setiger]
MLNNEVNYSLICAVREGRLERVRELVSSFGLSYSPGWSEGYTLLCDAIKNERLEIVKFLLEYGAKVKSNNNNVNTPLHLAVSKEYSDIIETLLNRGAYVDAQNKEKQTSLYLAVQKGNETIVRLLLGRGASTYLTDSWENSPLHIACSRQNNLNIVELLINHGAYVNCSAPRSCDTPLHLAVQNGYEEVVSIFLQYGNDVNATTENGFTPLHIAVQNRYEKIVDILLNNGANVNTVRENGLVPLHIAVKKGYTEIVQTLLEHGANVELNLKGNITPLHIAANSTEERTEIIDCILQHDIDVNQNDYYYNDEENYDFDGRGITLHEKYELIAQDIKLYTIKLKAAGLYVSEKNLRTVDYNVDQFENESEEDLMFFSYERELYEFEPECRKELKKIKSKRLDTSVSLHDILTTNNPKYILNKALVRDLESFNYEEFPVYGSLIESKFKSDKKRIVLLESGKKSFNILMKVVIGVILPILPSEIVEKILSYLENRDLRNLILCCDNLESQSNRPNTSLSGVETSSSIQVKLR